MATVTDPSTTLDAASLFNVKGLVALVTGGGTGIGLMITKALVQNGASKVYIAGRRLDKLQSAASSLSDSGTVIPIQCDITSKEDIRKAQAFVQQDTGYLNLLVCNAGVSGPHPLAITPETTLQEFVKANWEDLDPDDYTNTFAVNVTSVWVMSMAFLELLDQGNKKRNVEQSSQVIVTSSISGFIKELPWGGSAYGLSKAAANLLVKQLCVHLPQWGIRANCIAPGLFPSELTGPLLVPYQNDQGGLTIPSDTVPIQRLGDEKDMGGSILYLASRAGAYCNGLIMVVDGGRLNVFRTTS